MLLGAQREEEDAGQTAAPKTGSGAGLLSYIRLFVTLWIVARQAPLSMGFSKQEYWNGLPFPSPGKLPDPGIKPGSPALQASSLLNEPPGKRWVNTEYQLTRAEIPGWGQLGEPVTR